MFKNALQFAWCIKLYAAYSTEKSESAQFKLDVRDEWVATELGLSENSTRKLKQMRNTLSTLTHTNRIAHANYTIVDFGSDIMLESLTPKLKLMDEGRPREYEGRWKTS